MADNAVLGIQVKAEGADKAVKQLDQIDGRMKRVRDGIKDATDATRQLGQDGDKALRQARQAVNDLTDAEKKLGDAQQKMIVNMRILHDTVKDAEDRAKKLKQEGDAAQRTADKLNSLAAQAAALRKLNAVLDRFIKSIKDMENAMLEAYKPLEDAREKLAFFQQNAIETEDTIRGLTKSAADWGVSNTQLTKAATQLVKSDLDVSQSLEGIVKAAVASRNELEPTVKVFTQAAKGQAGALKTLREDYKLNLDALKQYGYRLDKTGAIAVKTTEEQKALGRALAEIAKTQYADAIDKQQQTLTGSIKRMEAVIENAKAAIGEAIAPSVIRMTNLLTDLVNEFNNMSPAAQKAITGLVAGVGGLTLAALSLAKIVTSVGLAVTGFEALKTAMTRLIPTAAAATGATAGTAGAVAKLSTFAAAAINPLTIVLTLCGAIANALIKWYEEEQKLESSRLDSAAKAQQDYYQQVRAINKALEDTGYKWQDIGDAAKRVKIIDILKNVKSETVDMNKALDASTKHLKALEEEEKAIEKERQRRKTLRTAAWIANPLIMGGAYLGGYRPDDSDLDVATTENQAKQLSVRRDIRTEKRIVNAQNDDKRLAEQWKAFQEAEAKRQAEEEKRRAERAKAIKKELDDVVSASRGLTPTDEGISKVNDLLEKYQRLRVQYEYFITNNKELNKEYAKGLEALEKQLKTLEKQKLLAEQKAEAEKVFAAQSAKADALKDKSYEEQRQGLADIIDYYKELINASAAFRDNAEIRKKAEAKIKDLTAERLSLEKKIAELQKSALEKLRDAKEREKELAAERAERAAEHAEKMGDTAAAAQYRKDAEQRRAELDDMQYQRARDEINAKYDLLLANAKGNSEAYNNLLKARDKDLANLAAERAGRRQDKAWALEEQQLEKSTSARAAETQKVNAAAGAADRLAVSLDKASGAAQKTANHEYGGIKSYIESGKPVEIVEKNTQGESRESWQQQVWKSRRDYWENADWQASLEAIRQQQAAMIQGPVLPAYGTPIPKGYEGRPIQQQNTYNLSVNGLNAAGVGTVDYMTMNQAGARMIARQVTGDLNQQFDSNSLL